ncbi:MAG: LAGLIDADG family homing endonuclease [Methanogenium sp.]|jgi:uncharacterized protein
MIRQKNYALTSASFNLTQDCNLACEYCFAGKKTKNKMTFETAKKCVNFIIDQCQNAKKEELNGGRKNISISFWGGEPLLEWELLKKIVLYTKSVVPKGIHINFGGTTNGVLLTPEKFDFLEEHKIYFLVSLDGTAESHDLYRKTTNGKGSHEIIMKNMKEVIKKWPFYKVRISLLAERIEHFYEDVKYLIDNKIHSIIFSPVYEGDWTDEKWDIFEEQSKKIVDLMYEYKQKGIEIHIEHFHSYCGPDSSNWPCGAGRIYFGFDWDGSIWPCLYGHEKIITKNSLKEMQDIKIDDVVLSHDGKYHPVKKLYVRDYVGEMIGIKPLYSNEYKYATPNHKVLAIKGGKCKYQNRICHNSCDGIPWSDGSYKKCLHKQNFKIDWYAISDLTKSDFVVQPILKETNDIPYENDLMYLFGWFLAEGSTSGKNKKPQQISFKLSSDEKDIAKELSDIFQKYYGKSGTIKYNHNTTSLRICSTEIAENFEKMFGKGALNKHVPLSFLTAPLEKQKSLLRGLFYGDGTHYKKGTSLTSISELLINQAKIMLLRLKIPCGYTTRKSKGMHKKSYVLNIYGQTFANKLFDKWNVEMKRQYNGRSWFQDEYFITPIKNINTEIHDGKVYNLEVEEAHSYVNSIIFSNCHRFNKFDDQRPWQEKETCMGHVDVGITKPEWRQQFIDFYPECGDCKRLKDTPCHGGCYGVNFDFHGSINIPYKGICKYTEKQKIVSNYYKEKLGVNFMSEQMGRQKLEKSCVCYNMCYLEDTDDEIINYDPSNDLMCHCYNSSYDGDMDTEKVAKPLGNKKPINIFQLNKKVEKLEQSLDKIANILEKLASK